MGYGFVLLMGLMVAVVSATEQATFTVCWWNIENFGVTDRYIGDRHVFAAMKPASEQQAVAAILQKINPDILGVAEVLQAEDDRYLKLLRNLLRGNGLDYPYFSTAKGQDPRIQMVLFSRFPLEAAPFLEDTFPVTLTSGTGAKMEVNFRVNRGFLNVRVHLAANEDLQILTAHLKSKRPEKGLMSDVVGEPAEAYVRRNEALLLRNHLSNFLRSHSEGRLLLMGDLNDTMQSRTLLAIREAAGVGGTVRDLPLKDYLGDMWTEFYVPEFEYARIDYMFVSEPLFRDFLPDRSYLYRWHEGEPKGLDHYEASDHRPLVATFKVLRP